MVIEDFERGAAIRCPLRAWERQRRANMLALINEPEHVQVREAKPPPPPPPAPRPTFSSDIDRAITTACAVCGVRRHVLFSRCRFQNVVRARHVAMALLREQGLSCQSIAQILGLQHHTTVMHGIKHAHARHGPALVLCREMMDQKEGAPSF